MATGFYNRFFYRQQRAELALHATANLRWMLLRSTSTYNFNPDDDFVGDLFTNGAVEISVPSYARQAAAGNAVTLDDANNRSIFSENTVAFGALEAGQTVKAFVLYEFITNDAASPLIFYTDGQITIRVAAPVAAPLSYNITGVTQANPAVVSSAGHTFVNGQKVKITGVVGMTQLNNNVYTVAGVVAGVSYQLSGINSSAYGAYTSGGSAKEVKNVYVNALRDAIVDGAALSFTGAVTGTVNGNYAAGVQLIEVIDLSAGLNAGDTSSAQSQVLLPAPLGGGNFNINFNASGFFYFLGGQ